MFAKIKIRWYIKSLNNLAIANMVDNNDHNSGNDDKLCYCDPYFV